MRILHIYRNMGQGGAQKIIYQLCDGNKDIFQCVASSGGVLVEELEKIGIRHYVIPDTQEKNIISFFKTLFILLKIIKNDKIDILHTHHRMCAFYARILRFIFPKVKHIYTAHSIFYGKRRLFRFSTYDTHIVAVGNGVKDNLISEYGIEKNKITTIYNTIDTSKFKFEKNTILNSLHSQNYYIVGFIGRISIEKGIDIFINAMRSIAINYSNIIGVVVGGGTDMEKYQEIVKSNSMKNIVFLGYQKNILSIIDQVDFVVSPSRYEGFPLTPIETFSQSKTIIASNVNGNNEIVENNKNGLLFDSENYLELAQKIIYLYSNNEIKKKLETEAYKTYLEKFDYNKFLDGYENLYINIAEN